MVSVIQAPGSGSQAISDRALVGILGVAGFLSAADNWVVAPLLPAIATGFGISIPLAGAVITAYLLPYGVMQPVCGFAGDQFGKTRLLRITLAGLALGTGACALSGSFGMLCFWRVITGFFASGIVAVSLAAIGDFAPPQERQAYVGRFMGMVFLGQGLSVGFGGALACFVNWRMVFMILALLSCCASFRLRQLPASPQGRESRRFFSEVLRVCLTSTGKVIFPLAFLTGFLLLGGYSFLGACLHAEAGLGFFQVGLVVMCFGFACLFSGARVGVISRSLGRRKTVIAGAGLALIAALLLAFVPRWPVGILAAICLGMGYIGIQSTLATLAFDVAPESKGLPSALIGLGLFGGGGLGTDAGGWLLSLGHYQTLWLALAAGMAAFIAICAAQEFE